jgi:hypothetical protein
MPALWGGHLARSVKQGDHTTLESIRATQLYRTLPHEVGHYVDYLNTIQETGGWDLFWRKSSVDKEAFAHRYATEFWHREKIAGHLPFHRVLDERTLSAEGLPLSWFIPFSNPDPCEAID